MNWTAIVLAGSRGSDDPVAQATGVSHKAFADVAGHLESRGIEAGRISTSGEGKGDRKAVVLPQSN